MAVKVGFVSLGCNKNLCDTENMMGLLAESGFEITPNPDEAEVVVVNTCGFIESAKQESIDTILEMARYKEAACRLLVVCGCLAQRYAEEIKTELPEVDVILGTTAIEDIVKAVNEGLSGKKASLIYDINKLIREDLPRIRTTAQYTAYLKIAEGCDNRCTYCAIPYIRGKYRSRSEESILAEAQALALDGVRELIVVAQDTTRYGIDLYGEKRLSALLRKLCAVSGIEWVRVHYCYPEEIDDELINVIKTEDKIVKYLDIPVQHGSDSVLRRMGRRTSRAKIEALIKTLRAEIPDITLRTSIITGFPGETQEEFTELCEFLEEVRFDRVGVFAYSCEEGTPAARMDGQLDEETKENRRDIVMELSQKISLMRNKSQIGKNLTVITEGFEDNLYYGRSGGESIEIDPKIYFGACRDLSAGDYVQVTIKDCDVYDLYGEECERMDI
ncbi:MAG: 30S ribosomal protein S12 methylthiotransferase RimO [Ruminococcaceae bacterium]|nr:30S ribosomal protein S12 methylthiotransferase RimO [Oscillospiraceae bacterium]